METIKTDFQIDFGNATDIGCVRERNEDYMETFKSSFGDVFIVCDGMGGHIGGEIASRLAVQTIKDYVINNPEGHKNTKQVIRDALNLANTKIYNKWKEEPELKGMGTTCVILIVRPHIAYYGNIGDSRLYICRNNKLYQLTKDQSFVQTLIDQRLLSYQDADNHPRKNEILQALGISENITPQINEIGLQIYKGDKFLICSDGLSGMVNDSEILRYVNDYNPISACKKLISLAKDNGGSDNITLQIVEIRKGEILTDDIKDLIPEGAIDKNITPDIKKFSRKHDPTMELPGFVNIEKKRKVLGNPFYLGVFGLILLVCAFLIYNFLIKNDEVNKKNIISQKNITEKGNELGILTDSLKKFLNELYTDDTNEVKVPVNIYLEKIIYITKDNSEKNWGIKELKENIKKNRLKFLRLINVSEDIYNPEFKLTVSMDKEELNYRVKLTKLPEQNDKYKLESIVFESQKQESVEKQKEKPQDKKEKSKPNIKQQTPKSEQPDNIHKPEEKKEEHKDEQKPKENEKEIPPKPDK